MTTAAAPPPIELRPLHGRELAIALARRLVTIGAIFVALLIVLVLLPVLLVATLIADVVTRSQLSRTRCVLMLLVYLLCEASGIFALIAVWVVSLPWTAAGRRRLARRTFRLQSWWTRTLLGAAIRLFGMRLEVEGGQQLERGPAIIFMRHASMIDTLLPGTIGASRHGLVLRYVVKHELVWDPCIDLAANRLPNHFVRRESPDSEAEVAQVQALMDGLGGSDAVLIYPEGTRFSASKRKRVIERLAATDAAAAERARNLRNLLPPRLGGSLGLLERNENADAVFLAHTGFEGAARAGDLWRGSLVHRTIKVRVERVPFGNIPLSREERVRWLYEQWSRIDDWLTEQGAGT